MDQAECARDAVMDTADSVKNSRFHQCFPDSKDSQTARHHPLIPQNNHA